MDKTDFFTYVDLKMSNDGEFAVIKLDVNDLKRVLSKTNSNAKWYDLALDIRQKDWEVIEAKISEE